MVSADAVYRHEHADIFVLLSISLFNCEKCVCTDDSDPLNLLCLVPTCYRVRLMCVSMSDEYFTLFEIGLEDMSHVLQECADSSGYGLQKLSADIFRFWR